MKDQDLKESITKYYSRENESCEWKEFKELKYVVSDPEKIEKLERTDNFDEYAQAYTKDIIKKTTLENISQYVFEGHGSVFQTT